MSSQFATRNVQRTVAFSFAAAGFALLAGLGADGARFDNPPPGDAVGAIEGEAIAIAGPMTVDTVNGQIITVLRSGSDVRVKSGTARINLVEGGQIAICGPAHFSVLKSGSALTIALDTGTIHARIEREPALTVYTPQIQAQPVAIGDGAQDSVVGFDVGGAMCIRTNRGALRLEQQLTGQSVVVPQGGDVFLANGQIDSLRSSSRTGSDVHSGSTGRCSCELQIAEAPPPQISHLATAEEVRQKNPEIKPNIPPVEAPKSAPKEEPIYQVFVPPLIFNANAKVQPEVDPRMIVLVRRVRVRPTLIFQGKVEGDAVSVVATNAAPKPPTRAGTTYGSAPAPQPGSTSVPNPAPAPTSVVERVRIFVRKLWQGGS